MALALRLVLLSFFFLAWAPVFSFPVDRHVHGVRQAWTRQPLRHESNLQIPREGHQISVNQTAADPVLNSTTNSTGTINSTTTQPPSVTFATNAVGTISSSALPSASTNQTAGGAIDVNPTTTKPPAVSSTAAGTSTSSSFLTATTVPIVTTTAVTTSSVLSPTSAAPKVTATSTGTTPITPTTSTVPTTTTAIVTATSSVSTTNVVLVGSTVVGTPSVIVATTAAPTTTSTLVSTSSILSTTAAGSTVNPTTVGTSFVTSTRTAAPSATTSSIGNSSANPTTTVSPTVTSTAPVTSSVGSTTSAVPTTTSTSVGTSSVISTTTIAPTLASTSVGTSSVNPTTTVAPTVPSTTVATSVNPTTTAAQAVTSASPGASSVIPKTTVVPTVTSTTVATSSVISTTTSVATTATTSASSASIILTTTIVPTVTSTSLGTAPIISATTASPTVTSASVGTHSIIFTTTGAPTASSTSIGTSSVLATTPAVPTTSTAIGTSSVIPTTTVVPTATSTSVGTAPTISGTTAMPTTTFASASTAAVLSTTTVAPHVTVTAADNSSIISTTTVAPMVSSTATGTSPVIATSTGASTTPSTLGGNSSVIPATTTVPTVTSVVTGTSSVVFTTTASSTVTRTTVASSTVPSTVPSTSTAAPVINSTSPSNTTPSSPCPTNGASANTFRMNVGGGAITEATMGAENENYLNSKRRSGISMSDATNIIAEDGPARWDEAYRTYRWVASSVLRYQIPVKRGNYTVKLLFAESVHNTANARQFDVFINGAEREHALDVYASVGKNVGLLKEYTNVTASASVEIALIKVVDHPMLSGIIIEGPGAGARAVGGGCSSTADAELEFNNGFDHRAHAVPNGPYNATDFDKVGSAFVSVDGTLSHSHYSDPGPPEVLGRVVSYRWTWTEIVNGSEVMRENNDKSGKFRTHFPVGKTLITLEVVDNTGDSSADYAEIDVRPSTKEGAYCYGYTLGNASMPSVPDLSSLDFLRERTPEYGDEKTQILFNAASDFGASTLFEGSFMYRCNFFLSSNGVEGKNLSLNHNGPFVLYQSGAVVAASDGSGETELHLDIKVSEACEILYFRDARVNPAFELRADGAPLAATHFAYDESEVLPVISRLSETESAPSGGGNIRIFGSGFFSDVKIFFGENEARNVLKISSKLLQVRIPHAEEGEVMVTVQTKVAVSNGIKFLYADPVNGLEQPIIFETKLLQHRRLPKKQNFPLVAAITYGPDFRLYLGTYNKGHIHAVTVHDNYKVREVCTHNIGEGRSALGLAFSPFSNRLRLYFSSSLVFWKKFLPFEEGWVNGKIETVDFSRLHRESGRKATGECAFNQREVVTGLPVSAHDHSVNKLEFTPDGRLLITIGGFTNGGISIPGRKRVPGDPPDDRFGGVGSNPLSAAIVSCPVHTVARITYDNYTHPEKAKVVDGKVCFVYASGVRNSFGMTLHTNGHIYATDNGGSRGNGDFSTDCNGGSIPATKQRDKLFRVQRGGYHGHPNLNRRECVHYPANAVQPILGDIESSTDGVMEYRSNVFGGRLKGDLVLTKFASNNQDGRISQVKLDGDGGVAPGGFIENLYGRSGLTVVEGPRGELVMPQVYQNGVLFVYPKIKQPNVTFVIGVLPKKGPASGGTKVMVSGFGFSKNSTVWFGNGACRNVRMLTERKLVCRTPEGEKNTLVSVVVEGVTGRSPTYGSDYWYF